MHENELIKIQAAAFRRLINHLQKRTDAQNIDLMILAGFCRNCLADWVKDAARDEEKDLSKEDAREMIYGMPYAEFKEKYQLPATDEQLARMAESVGKN